MNMVSELIVFSLLLIYWFVLADGGRCNLLDRFMIESSSEFFPRLTLYLSLPSSDLFNSSLFNFALWSVFLLPWFCFRKQ